MQFKRLANLIIQEAKDEKPGQRYFSARNSSGPAGMSSTPIGRSDYNPQISSPSSNPLPPDTKAESVRNTEIILKNAFRLIKGDTGFRNAINKILEAYGKKRKSISSAQEKVLTLNPGHIDKLYSQKVRLERIIAALEEDPRQKQFIAELEKINGQYEKASEQLEGVITDIKDIFDQNEATSLKYQDAVIKLIQATAHEQYEALVKGLTDQEKATVTLQSLDQLDTAAFSEETLEQEEMRIKLLFSLISEDEELNPLYKFFFLAQQRYENAINSDNIFQKIKAFTQNVSVETLFNRLPLSAFTSFYNATRDDIPLRPLTGARRKQAKAASPIRALLDQIIDAASFDAHRDELMELVQELNIDSGRLTAIQDILNGPYLRRGASAVQRLKGLLGGVLREGVEHTNFDLMLLATLSKYDVA